MKEELVKMIMELTEEECASLLQSLIDCPLSSEREQAEVPPPPRNNP